MGIYRHVGVALCVIYGEHASVLNGVAHKDRADGKCFTITSNSVGALNNPLFQITIKFSEIGTKHLRCAAKAHRFFDYKRS